MAYRWILSALGQDRPGIVAAVTRVLYEQGCNLEDSAMTLLEGEFTMMLIFSHRKRLAEEDLNKAFDAVRRRLKLSVFIKPLSPAETRAAAKPKLTPYLISVYGADRAGIVAQFSDLLAKRSISITDVTTHRVEAAGKRKKPLYLLLLEVVLPAQTDPAGLRRSIARLAGQLKVDAEMRAAEVSVL